MNGLWSVTEAASHINVLELRTVVLALRHFLPRLSGQHVLVRTDNTAALAYINRQGGVRSQSLHHWANRLLLCLHPQVIEQIWMRFFRAQVDLFVNRQNTCCPLWFSLGGDKPHWA